jgi:hypothetical protein
MNNWWCWNEDRIAQILECVDEDRQYWKIRVHELKGDGTLTPTHFEILYINQFCAEHFHHDKQYAVAQLLKAKDLSEALETFQRKFDE